MVFAASVNREAVCCTSSCRTPLENAARRGALTASAWSSTTFESPMGSTLPTFSRGEWVEAESMTHFAFSSVLSGARSSSASQIQTCGFVSTAPSRLCRISSSLR